MTRAVRLANDESIQAIGPNFFLGSEPRKKFRHTDRSGAMARSWYTVAMPRARASRGESKLTGSPSMR